MNVLQQKDTFVLMPTGAGKSMCFQVPALVLPGVAVVISPLIALMENQVKGLKDLNVRAVLFNSTLTKTQKQAITEELKSPQCGIKLLYVTPELIATDFKQVLKLLFDRSKLSLFAVDEAHCISSWGTTLFLFVFFSKPFALQDMTFGRPTASLVS